MITNVTIQTMAPEAMRYRTVGDWFYTADGALIIQVADTGNWTYNLLVAIHELIEVFMCAVRGITLKQVDSFDFAHEDDEDPGCHPKAPYHAEHMTAMGVEMVLAAALGVKWRIYEDALDATWKKTPKRVK